MSELVKNNYKTYTCVLNTAVCANQVYQNSTMLSEDPLSNVEFLTKIDSLRTSRCGRPRSSNTILFCPQPASIISTKIREEMKLQSDNSKIISKHDIKCDKVSSVPQSDDDSDIVDTYMRPADESNCQNSCKKAKCGKLSLSNQRVSKVYIIG